MKVLEARSSFLTDYEVMLHLDAMEKSQEAIMSKQSRTYHAAMESENLKTVQFELNAYLRELPCKNMTPEKMRTLLKRLKEEKWHITKVEKLMLLNQVPSNEAQISVLLEEYGERFSEEERIELLQLVRECLQIENSARPEDEEMQ